MDLLLSTNFLHNLVTTFGSQTFWIKALELILSLSILVFIHELGHYMWARIFGIKVNKFYLFFNPSLTLWKWKPKNHKHAFMVRASTAKITDEEGNEYEDEDEKEDAKLPSNYKATWRDTEYGLGWLPLGGYCAIDGMVDETQSAEKLKRPVKDFEFRSKPAWKRLMVMIGGVLNNFLLALVIYAGIVLAYGEEFIPMQNATSGYEFSPSAHKIGFVDGDIPLSADGKKLEFLDGKAMQAMVEAKQVQVLRNGSDTVAINIPDKYLFTVNKEMEDGRNFIMLRTPVVVDKTMPNMGAEKAHLRHGDHLIAVNGVATPSFNVFTAQLLANKGKTVPLTVVRNADTVTVDAPVDNAGKLGFQLANPITFYKTITKHYNIVECVPRGIKLGVDQMVSYVKSLRLIFTKEGAQSLGSFGAIGNLFPEKWDWQYFWSITAFLSIILAVMNILPIPILDGGYVLFLLIEIIFRKKPSMKFMNVALRIGLWFIILLMAYAIGNDVYRFLIK